MERALKCKEIALFMGFQMVVEDYHGINIIRATNGKTFDIRDLLYYDSWDWLIPVLEKIKHLVCETEFTYRFYLPLFSNLDINSTYEAALTFINWYKTQ